MEGAHVWVSGRDTRKPCGLRRALRRLNSQGEAAKPPTRKTSYAYIEYGCPKMNNRATYFDSLRGGFALLDDGIYDCQDRGLEEFFDLTSVETVFSCHLIKLSSGVPL